MTMTGKKLVMEAEVTETLPNLTYRISLSDGRSLVAYTSGKMRINKIKVAVGDFVQVELDPYNGHATNRIIRRL